MDIRIDDLRGPEVKALLETHLAWSAEISPPEACHALNLDALRAPNITFWTAWEGERLLGSGALKDLGNSEGEVKSMYTAEDARGKGVASAILAVVLKTARRKGMNRVSLETGATEDFAPARNLYAVHGFKPCAPFGDYEAHDFSTFMTLKL